MVDIKRRKKIMIVETPQEEDPCLNKTPVRSHWKKITGGDDNCYVCDKKFKTHHEKIYIGVHRLNGSKLFRHVYCECGSSNWVNKFGGPEYQKYQGKTSTEKKRAKKETTTIIRRRTTK